MGSKGFKKNEYPFGNWDITWSYETDYKLRLGKLYVIGYTIGLGS